MDWLPPKHCRNDPIDLTDTDSIGSDDVEFLGTCSAVQGLYISLHNKQHSKYPRWNAQIWDLPVFLLAEICKYLPVASVLNLSRTCRLFYYVCQDNALWKHLYHTQLYSVDYAEALGWDRRYGGWKNTFKERYARSLKSPFHHMLELHETPSKDRRLECSSSLVQELPGAEARAVLYHAIHKTIRAVYIHSPATKRGFDVGTSLNMSLQGPQLIWVNATTVLVWNAMHQYMVFEIEGGMLKHVDGN